MTRLRRVSVGTVLAWMAAGSLVALAQQPQERVYSTRDVAPDPCRCPATQPGSWWGPSAQSMPWFRPRLGVAVDRHTWLGFDMPAPLIGMPDATSVPGGIRFEVTPADAEIWVDDALAGPAVDFGPVGRALPLPPGIHRIEVRAPGFVPLLFDALITPGYHLQFRGTLRPLP